MRFALIALVLATPAVGEPANLTWTFPTWPVGSSYLLSVDGKPPERSVTAGKEALGYRVNVFDPEGHQVYTFWTDDSGATTAFQMADADKPDRYIPNDCSTTPGRCEYTDVIAGSGPRRAVRETVVKEGGVRFTVSYADGTLLYSGQWDLDADGFVIRGWTESADGTRTPSLMIGKPVRAAE
jgi:hypothetical protein